jgi:ribosome-binding factor A
MDSTRQLKIGRLLQKDLGELIQRQGLPAYDGALVSVTTVRVSTDLSFAKVYVSIFPSAKAKEVKVKLDEHAKMLRYELGLRVRHQLRIVPELAFYIDDSLDYVERIDNLLK